LRSRSTAARRPRAFAVCYAAAKTLLERPPSDPDDEYIEVECPDGFITFRLRRVTEDTAAAP